MPGDTLFQLSLGRTDLPGGSLPDLLRSIQEGLFSLPDPYVVYPGHGPATSIGIEKEHNPFVSVKTEPTMATTLVTVISLCPTGGKAASATIDATDDEVKVVLNAPGASATCHINDTESVPGIKVS